MYTSSRIFQVLAALKSDGKGNFTKSREYAATVDASERAALSYLLGMTQAHLLATKVRNYTHTADMDRVLRTLGMNPGRSRRADLLAVDCTGLPGPAQHAIWEAKGTSGKYNKTRLTDAGVQAQATPALAGVTVSETIASLAYFDDPDALWSAALLDPPAFELRYDVGISSFLYAYYAPLVDMGLFSARSGDGRSDDRTLRYDLPGIPVSVSIPAEIADAVISTRIRRGERVDEWRYVRAADKADDEHVMANAFDSARERLLSERGGRREESEESYIPLQSDLVAVEGGDEFDLWWGQMMEGPDDPEPDVEYRGDRR